MNNKTISDLVSEVFSVYSPDDTIQDYEEKLTVSVTKALTEVFEQGRKADEELRDEGRREERAFILNILNGIDIADGECDTKAIRGCLNSRSLGMVWK